MLQSFLISFREGLYCAFLILLFLLLHETRKHREHLSWVLSGVAFAFIAGFSSGYVPAISSRLPSNEAWTAMRFIGVSVLFYLSMIVYLKKDLLYGASYRLILFFTGMLLYFFESRAVGFLVRDFGLMLGNQRGVLLISMVGTMCGFSLLLLRRYVLKIPGRHTISFATLCIVIASLKFMLNGVHELENIAIPSALQRGLTDFLSKAVPGVQSLLVIPDHPFLPVVFSGLGEFLASDRTAMTLVVIFLMTPPVFLLLNLFGRPDPIVRDIKVNAQKRLKIAFFRKDMVSKSLPILVSFLLLLVVIHMANISLNPMYDPVPMPVRASEDGKFLVVPLSDSFGDISDGKLRKYVYYHGNKEILFLAVLKPDGSVGVALDECEICNPAEWNKAARGYAQRGATLVCKYCMTPIPLPTINNPGGCNPIPLPFSVREGEIVLDLDEFLEVYRKLQEMEKKGTHI